ncbi:MAG: tol-pal system protein YbgF [Burkholderiaceae bacterium]
MRAVRPALHAVAIGALLIASWPARAGLFDDDEARKAILDLRSKVAAGEQARGELAATVKQQADQIQTLQRGLLDLSNQNEQLRAEIARLRGQDEQMLRDLAEVQRKQKDIAQGVDERMRKLEPQQVSVDGKDFLVDPEEKRAYDEAMAVMRGGEFDRAAPMLVSFLKRYPASGYVDSARYWLGNAQYGQRQYKDAITTFRGFVTAAPDHLRAPEALLALANCQAELKDNKSAKKTLDELIKQYPKSEAAQAGRERIASLK